MSWKYDHLNNSALHIETDTTFRLRMARSVKSPEDFDLIPPAKKALAWSVDSMNQLKQELWIEIENAWAQRDLRMKMQGLIQKKLGGDNHLAANVISKVSGKQVSARSIQAWLIEPNRKSSRTCPIWAVDALENCAPSAVASAHAPAASHSQQVREKLVVDLADRSISADEQRNEKWAKVDLLTLPKQIALLEQRFEDHLGYFDRTFLAIKYALKESTNFDEFKINASNKLDEAASVAHLIFDTKNAIQNNLDEFSNPEGILSTDGVKP